MCGLFGLWGNKPLPRKMLPFLERVANSQVSRGRDAFGIAWRGADDTMEAFKRSGSVSDHMGELARAEDSLSLIGHTRWTTHGSAECNDNNHPHEFQYRGQKCWLVHNGVICNYRQVAYSHGLTLRTECDSEILARFVEEANGSLLDRFRECIANIDSGSPFAMAALTPSGLILARRGNPLFWSETGARNWFASTRHALPGTVHEVPEGRAFHIPFGDGQVEETVLRARTISTRLFAGSDLFT